MLNFTLIQKEDIKRVKFTSTEVLNSNNDISQRRVDLEKAMILGNAYHGKIKIVFETTDGIKRVETTLWAATDKFVTLKGGVNIPIHSIYRVEIY